MWAQRAEGPWHAVPGGTGRRLPTALVGDRLRREGDLSQRKEQAPPTFKHTFGPRWSDFRPAGGHQLAGALSLNLAQVLVTATISPQPLPEDAVQELTAVEFLHATFGEYLVARLVMNELTNLLAVSELDLGGPAPLLMGVHQPGREMRQGGVPQPPVGEHLLFRARV